LGVGRWALGVGVFRPLFLSFLTPLFAVLFLFQPSRLSRAPVGFRDLDAVGTDRAADEDRVAARGDRRRVLRIPAVFALEAIELLPVERADLEGFVLLEGVLLQLLPVVVPPGQDLLHEGFEVGLVLRSLGGGGRLRLRDRGGDRQRGKGRRGGKE
jgi:hypothetical protein